jgi:hypothetical protein
VTVHVEPIPPEGVDRDAWSAAVASVRAYCGWHIAPEVTETLTVDGSGTSVQMLPTLRLVDLISITNAGSVVTDPEWSTSGMVRGCWTSRLRGVVAEMRHGFEEWPSDLVAVIAEMVAGIAQARVSQVTSRSHQVSFDLDDVAERQRQTLDRYRLGILP